MNENEMNYQDVTNSQNLGSEPVNPNQNFQPIKEESVPTIDLMDDFKEAVVNQPEIEPVVPTVVVPTEPVDTAIKQPVQEVVVPVEPEIIEVQKETIVKSDKKNNHWAFIFTLFAIVGAFVILLPLLVRIFGY